MTSSFHFRSLALMAGAIALLLGCTSSPRSPAPVEDRAAMGRAPTHTAAPESAKPVPSQESAVKPGYYTVQRGDTLTRIGLDHGQGWRDLAQWNQLSNPDLIEVGQVLRVVPPGGAVETSGVVVRPIPPSTASASGTPQNPAGSKEPAAVKEGASKPLASSAGMQFVWPAQGPLTSKFDASTKGIEIAGKKGDPVWAAEAGKVAYVGESLRGYGKLILIKHNGYLTAYGHNDKFHVKEDQQVSKGQKIAEMGNTDADGYKLKFEIRDTAGKALNPVTLLPQR